MKLMNITAAVAAVLIAFTATAQTGKEQAQKYGYPDTDGTCSYSGPKVKLNRYTAPKEGTHKLTSTYIGKLKGRKGKGYAYQGMDIYRKYILSCQNQGVASVYRFNGKKIELLGQFELASFNVSNHSNVACFGTEFFSKEDPLPLVYISQAQKETINGLKDVLYVERVSNDFKSSQLVQTIVFDDVNKLFGYALQWVIDKENGFLYGFGNTVSNDDPANCHRIMKFKLPDFRNIDKYGFLVLHESDALENYLIEDVSDFRGSFIGQGLLICADKLYMPTGVGTEDKPSILYVWDLKARKMCNVIDLSKTTHSEMEDCGRFGKRLVIQAQHGLFSLKF